MRLDQGLLAAGVYVLLCASARAQVPAGPTFRVNAYSTAYQASPDVAMEPDGDFVVVWNHRDESSTFSDVFARRFTSGGVAIGDDFLVNAYTTSEQLRPHISQDARGDSVVVWTDFRVDFDVFGQRLAATGVPLGGDFQVNQATTGLEFLPALAVAPDGRFVVAWRENPGADVLARRYDPAGNALGGAFRVNTYTTAGQSGPDVATDPAGNFTVVWHSTGQDAPVGSGVFGQRFDASGQPLGAEFQVNGYSTGNQAYAAITMRRDGSYVVAWEGEGGASGLVDVWVRRFSSSGLPQGVDFQVSAVTASHFAGDATVAVDETGNFVVAWIQSNTTTHEPQVKVRRFTADGAPRGAEFQVVVASAYAAAGPVVASDAVGNFLVVWAENSVFRSDVFGRRFGGLRPEALRVDIEDNGVFEPKESRDVRPSWRNVNGAAQTFGASALRFSGPPAAGVEYQLTDASATYGTVANGAVAECVDCYRVGVTFAGARPATHWDATLDERITPDALGQHKQWTLHIGASFSDVPRTSQFYPFVETVLHRGISGGCGPTTYCPLDSVTREQMSVFVLVAKEGAGYVPPPCATPVFGDVPASSPFCPWIEELARRGVTGGCGGGNFCPAAAVSREQMPVFVLRTLDPTLQPPDCTAPVFDDVPADSPYCRWIEELARRGVTGGCGGGNYCPTAAVTREQMAVFLTGTFGLTLYGP